MNANQVDTAPIVAYRTPLIFTAAPGSRRPGGPTPESKMAIVSMARRDGEFDSEEENIMSHLFQETRKFRTWE